MRKIVFQVVFLACTISLSAQSQTVQQSQDNKDRITSSTPADSTKSDSAKYWKQFNLGEVTVKAQRKLVKADIDRTSYDVQNDEDSKSRNILEILRKVPMVTVDGQDNIKIKGSSDFKIYRNGHADPSFSGSNVGQILKSIPANMIKKIEVITDPGAREDAEGTHYILNIVMNDNTKMGGVTGNLASTADLLHNSVQEDGYITTQMGKWVLSFNYGFVHLSKSLARNRQYNSTWFKESGQTLLTQMNGTDPTNAHYGDLNASYDIDSLNLFTLALGGYYYLTKSNSNGYDQMLGADGSQIYKYDANLWEPKNNSSNLHGRLDYQHKTHLNGELITASYMLSTNREKDNQQTEFSNPINMPVDYSGYRENKDEKFVEHTFQFDYTRPFAKYHKLEIGAKYINRENKSNTSMLYDNASTTTDVYSNFNHNTQIAAGYGEWIFSHKKWAAQAGMRYEYSYLNAKYPDGSGKNFHRNLHDWVPSASLKYTFSPVNSLKLSYSTFINRPDISYLNPAVVNTPTAESYGNSTLNSSRNTSFTLEFMHIQQKFTWNVSPFYTFSNNQISDVKFVRDEKTVSTYDDILHEKSFGVDAYAQIAPFMGTQISISTHLEKKFMNNHSIGLSLNAWSGTTNVSVTQNLPWNLRLSLGYGGSFGQSVSSIYGYDTNWHYHFVGLQRSFLKDDRLTVMFGADNPFDKNYTRYTNRTVQGDFTSLGQSDQHQRTLGIRISYRFGRLKASVKKVENTIQNDDIIGSSKSQTGGSATGIGGGQK